MKTIRFKAIKYDSIYILKIYKGLWYGWEYMWTLPSFESIIDQINIIQKNPKNFSKFVPDKPFSISIERND